MGMDSRIFTNGKISKILLKFAIPAVISLLVLELYNMVDTLFVGIYIGPDAIGALTIAFPIQRLLIAVGMLIAIGTSSLVSRNLGENNLKALKNTILNAFLITGLSLTTLSLLIYIFKNKIIYFLGASSTIFPYADNYISVILIGGIFQCLTVVLCYIMTALGNTKITLYANSLGAIINIFINYLLVAILGFGVIGAAIATVISQAIGFAFTLYKFKPIKKSFNLSFSLKSMKLSINKGILISIFIIGFSSFIIEISDAIVAVILNNLLAYNGGDEAIIIIGIVTKVSMFMFITIIGISSAMQPIVAFSFGASDKLKVREALITSIKAVSLSSVALWLILMIFSKQIIGFFLKDLTLLNDTVLAFRICISLLPSVSIYYICIYYYQAIGKAKLSFILSLYRQLIVFIPLATILTIKFGVMGALISYPIADFISCLTSIYFILKALNLNPLKYTLNLMNLFNKYRINNITFSKIESSENKELVSNKYIKDTAYT
ncbi:putative efflux protein, MATE family [Clostridium cavendishii DSM 21758]|uniref:Multidrug export protein MepA n=1 Tax=Clostridium cavendishii DSM 21758 TaxID=1121302 RepID=A0A1M6CK75_9CLOT|nr:MATE family efflux transporter [Clostridium cavendishii]SHI61420.1 putative efflux protein, MATE family [Clostridium cavendishii DSM 21758]